MSYRSFSGFLSRLALAALLLAGAGGFATPAFSQADTTAPTVDTATVNGAMLTIVFNENLAAAANLANSAFSVKRTPSGESSSEAVSLGSTAPSISGKTVVLTLSEEVLSTDTLVKVSYTKPASGTNNKLQDAANNQVASFTDQAVDNTSTKPVVALTLSPASISEDGGSTTVTASTNRGPTGGAVTVTVSAAPVSPATSSDYTLSGTVLTIASGATTSTGTVTIAGVDNSKDGPIKSVTVSGAVSGADAVAPKDVTLSITDNDDPPEMSIATPSAITEGDSGSSQMTFAVSLDAVSDHQVTAGWSTTNGTATGGQDFTAVSNGTVTIAPGSTTANITVDITGDETDEENETFTVTLKNPSHATLASAKSATGTITDNDDPPALSIDDASIGEGNSATKNLTLTVDMTAASGKQVTVKYATSVESSDTAVSNTDFTATTGTLTIAKGNTSGTFNVPIRGDTTDEPDETFTVTLSMATNATISDATATATITDDDDPPKFSITDRTVTEKNSDDVNATFTVSLSAISAKQATVEWETADGTATQPADYTQASGTLTFTAGQTAKTVTVTVKGDTLDEDNETFTVGLSSASNATIMDSSGTGTITDNDNPPVFSIAAASANEGSAVSFTVTLTPVSGRQTTVAYDTDGGGAVRGTDFTRAMGTLTFAAGVTSRTFAVTTLQDSLNEDNETFTAKLTSATNATLHSTAKTATGTINDNDPLPVLAIAGPSALTEGDSGSQNAVFTVTLTPVSGREVRVDWETVDGTATAMDDFKGEGSTLTFAAGTTSKTVRVAVSGDTKDEHNESFTAELSNANNATISTSSAIATITDDDEPPNLSIANASVTEKDADDVDMEFTVSLSAESGKQVTVNYDTAAGTAKAGTDYGVRSSALTFAAGTTAKTVTVSVKGDLLDEDNETFTVRLSSASNAGVTRAVATGTITDNDPLPELSVANVSESEDAGTMTFTVSLGAESGRAVEVSYRTSGGTATEGTDYAAAAGTLTFAAGDTAKTVAVTLLDETLDEHNETFTMGLSSPSNATVSSSAGTATGTIEDDDPPPNVSIANGSVIEPDGTATRPMTFAVTMDAVSAKTVNVSYATSVESSDTATSNTDFTAKTGTLTFSANTTVLTQSITVLVRGDDVYEGQPTETFTVKLSSAVNVAVDDGTATGTIQDDEGPPRLTISDEVKASPESGNLTFTVTLLGDPTTSVVTANWATSNAGTDEEHAAAGEDYTASSGSLTFPARATAGTARTFNVGILSDALDEFNEVFTVTLSGEQNATLDPATATGTITDDDAEPRIRIHRQVTHPDTNDILLALGDEGGTVRFPVTLSAPSGRTVTVQYSTADSERRPEGDRAVPGRDYTGEANTDLSIPPGDTVAFAEVTTIDDSVREDTEYLDAVLASPQYATLRSNHARAEGRIRDDEGVPEFTIVEQQTAQEDDGTISFTVTLSTELEGAAATVDWTTVSGTAVQGTDFTAADGTLSFAAGVTEASVVVTLTDDTLDEIDETFTVELSDPVSADLGSVTTATATIEDNDDPPEVAVADASAREDAGRVRFTAVLAGASGRTAVMEWSTADDTATAGEDYTAVAGGTVTFAPGDTEETFDVALLQDTVSEPDETFTLTLASADGTVDLTGLPQDPTGTIEDDEALPEVSVADVRSAAEAGTLTFTATLSNVSAQVVTMAWATADGTATAGEDYTAVDDGELTFAASDTEETFTVTLTDDSTHEGDETFRVVLSDPVNAALGSRSSATGTISDDDGPPRLSIKDATLTEGDSGDSGTMAFEVSLAGRPAADVTVEYATRGGSATEGTDYEQKTGTLNFDLSAGETAKTIEVAVLGDDVFEGDEEFTVRLSNARMGTETVEIVIPVATGKIDENELGPELVVSDAALTLDEGDAAGAAFTVALRTQPTAEVTVAVSLPSSAELIAAPARLVFTTSGWATAQTVTVKAGADDDAADDTAELTLRATSRDSGPPTGYNRLSETVDITVRDPDTAGITVAAKDPLNVDEGESAAYTVALNTQPTANVTVEVSGLAGTGVTASPARLVFTPSSWQAKTVTVRAAQDANAVDESVSLTHSVTAAATEYTGLTAGGVNVEVEDDDKPGLKISEREITIVEGYEKPVTVALNTRPTADVTVAFPPGDGDLSVAPSTLTFTENDWSRRQTMTLTLAPDGDNVHDGQVNLAANVSSTDTAYNRLLVTDAVSVIRREMTVSFARAEWQVPEGNSVSVQIRLAERLLPGASSLEVPLTVTPGTATRAVDGVGDFTVGDPQSVTFGPGDSEKTFPVRAIRDSETELDETLTLGFGTLPSGVIAGDRTTAEVTIARYRPPPPTVTAPAAAIAVGDAEAGEGDGSMSFAVRLSQPSGSERQVGWSTADGTAAAGEDYTAVTDGVLTFGPAETVKTIRVRLLQDEVHEGDETFTVTVASADGALNATATGTIVDDDTDVELVFSAAGVSVTEGGAASYTVALFRAPAEAVTVSLASSDPGAVAVSPASLRFAPDSWSAAQTVEVRGVADPDSRNETATVAHTVGGVDAGSVVVTVSEPAAVTAQIRRQWLARFVRTMSTEVVDMLVERLSGQGSQASQLTLGGRQVQTGEAPDALHGFEARGLGWQDLPWNGVSQRGPDDEPDSWTISGRELLLGSSFNLTTEGIGDGGARLSGWGRVSPLRLAGADGGSVEGLTGLVGADYRAGRILGGTALSFSEGSGSHEGLAFASELTAVHPYFQYSVSEDVSLWSLLGYGTGYMTWSREEDDTERVRSELDMSLVAVGARGSLAKVQGFDIALKSDAFTARIGSGASGPWKETATASRLRVLVEGSRTEDGVSSRFGAGLRRDDGDDRSDSGIELGAGLGRERSPSGVSASARVDGFVTDGAAGEWNAAGTLGYDPGEAGRGIGVAASLSWGEPSENLDGLWSREELSAPAESEPEGRASLKLGYGLIERGTGGLMTPFVETHWSDGGERRLRGGVSLVGSGRSDGLRMELAGERVESGTGGIDHRIGLTLSLPLGGGGPR